MPTPVLRPARPFILVRENLKKIGAVPLSEYLAVTRPGTSCINVSRHENEGAVRDTCLPEPNPGAAPMNSPAKEECISKLEDAVEATFADYSLADALRFDIARRSGDPNGIQCILTITRPDGAHRIYESQACHSRNHDAKVQVAEIAVEKGAIDFIRHGNVEMQEPEPESELPEPVLHGAMMQPDTTEATALAVPQDVPMPSDTGLLTEAESAADGDGEAEEDANVLEIERACEQWRPTDPRPDWVFYQSNETETTPARWGAAVRIHLTVPQVYSTEMAYGTAHAAKAACAELAIEKNVVRDIKNIDETVIAPTSKQKPAPPKLTTAISLDEWFAALPRPLPEILGTKSPAEMAATSMLNTLITKARGARFKIDYFFPVVRISDVYALHGCVLRIDRPGECRSYMVDPVFSRRQDARQAVSLLAMIQGAGEYIKQIGAEVDEKISPRLRTLVHDRIFTILGRKGTVDTHVWTFNIDREAYGCTLTVELGSKEHTYVAEPKYRTKADAKCAAALVAAERGLIELLRFRGEPPPPDYQPFWETFQAALQEEGGTIANEKEQTKKRKHVDGEPAPTASSGRRKRKRMLKMKLAEEAAAAAGLDQNESGESNAELQKPSMSESDTAGERLGVPSSGSEPSSSVEPQPSAAATQMCLSEKALGKKPSATKLGRGVEPVAADASPSQKALGKKPAIDSSTSHISRGVSLGKSSKSKSKSKHTANPVPIPQGYERLPPLTPAYPFPQPQPQPPVPRIQRPPPPDFAPPTRPPPRPYDLDYGAAYPHPQTHQHPYPPTRPPPTFGTPYPQPYPFTSPYPPSLPPQHIFTGPPPGHYSHVYEPRGEPTRRYAYGQGNSAPPLLPAHTPPQGMSQVPPPYTGNQPGSGGSRWGHTRR